MNRKPPALPDIEDATLRACLAPLMQAMRTGAELPAMNGARGAAPAISSPQRDDTGVPLSAADWRARTDDDIGVYRMVAVFLAMTDVERERAAREFPRQIAGTVTRFAGTKQRLADQYDTVTTALALLERAQTSAGEPIRANDEA